MDSLNSSHQIALNCKDYLTEIQSLYGISGSDF